MTETTTNIIVDAVSALTDSELDAAAASAREQYWSATGSVMTDLLAQLVDIIDTERLYRTRQMYELARIV